jgi:hypothetical protein
MAAGFIRRRTRVILGKVKGYITRKPPVRGPHITSQATQRVILQPRLRTRAILQKFGKRSGRATHVPPVRRPIEALQAIARAILRPRLRTRAFFLSKVFGRPTTKPLVRKPLVLSQAMKRIGLQTRLRIRSFFIRAVRSTVVVVITTLPKSLRRTSLAIFKRPSRVQVHLGKVFGRSTIRPPVRKPLVLSQAKPRAGLQVRLRTHIQFLRVFGHAAVQTLVKPHAPRVVLQVVSAAILRSRLHTHAFFIHVIRSTAKFKHIKIVSLAFYRRPPRVQTHLGKVFGHPTARPPIRPIRIVMFAAQARARMRFVHGIAILRKAAQAQVTTPANLKRLFMDIASGRLFWQVSPTSTNPILIQPLS